MDSLAEYTVSVSGRSRKVRVLRVDCKKTALIELDGKTVEVAFPNGLDFGEQALINVNGKNHGIRLHKNDRPMTFNVEVDGKQFVLQFQAKRRELSNRTLIAPIFPSEVLKKEKPVVKKSGVVTSFMPGKVVLLKVKVGDKVKAGDPLCVLEAMKMENEIVAPKEGTITEVKVEQGSFVDKGDVLVIIK
ncbi:MAG: biotin/lipoyl-containing protein [Candidatus Bathyarchaeia archaeon]